MHTKALGQQHLEMFRTSKKVEPNFEPNSKWSNPKRTEPGIFGRTELLSRTELRSFSLILTNHIVLQCFDTLAVILMILIDHFQAVLFSQTWQLDYILDSPKWVVITELQVYCNYRIFGKKIKLLRKVIENKRKKDKKKNFKRLTKLKFSKSSVRDKLDPEKLEPNRTQKTSNYFRTSNRTQSSEHL